MFCAACRSSKPSMPCLPAQAEDLGDAPWGRAAGLHVCAQAQVQLILLQRRGHGFRGCGRRVTFVGALGVWTPFLDVQKDDVMALVFCTEETWRMFLTLGVNASKRKQGTKCTCKPDCRKDTMALEFLLQPEVLAGTAPSARQTSQVHVRSNQCKNANLMIRSSLHALPAVLGSRFLAVRAARTAHFICCRPARVRVGQGQTLQL